MKLIQKLAITILVLMLGTTVLFGNAVNEAAPVKESSPLELSIFRAGTETEWDKYYEASFERFKQHLGKDVKIEYTTVAWSGADAAINVRMAGGNAPDIIANAVGYLAGAATNGHVIPLDEYLEEWDDNAFYQQEARDLGVYKGNTYGIGYHWDPRVFVYRKDLFREAGLNPESPPKNWTELADYAIRLTKKSGNVVTQTGLEIPTTDTHNTAYIFLNQAGTRLVDEVNEMPAFDDPIGVETYEYLAKLAQYPVSTPHSATNSAEKPFLRGTAAMAYLTPSQLVQFGISFPELKQEIGLSYILQNRSEATFGGMYQWFITSQSKQKDLAWEYITFMLSEEETKQRIDALNSPPTRTDLAYYYAQAHEYNEVILQSALISHPWPKTTWSPLYRRHLDQAGQKIMFGKQDAKTALSEQQKLIMADLVK